MHWLAYLVTAMPWLAGGIVALALLGIIESSTNEQAKTKGSLPAFFAVGLGGLVGYLTLAFALWTLEKIELPTLSLSLNAVVVGSTLIAIVTLRFRPPRLKMPLGEAGSWTIITILCAFMAYTAYIQHQNPLFAWDAINHWASSAVEFIKEHTTTESANYDYDYFAKHPKTVVHITAWAAWVNLQLGGHAWAMPWFLCMASICMMGAGYVHALTHNVTMAALCALLLAMLPLAEAHTSISGYAELWLSAILMAGLFLSALGFHYQNYYYVAAGMLIGTLALAIKNTGLAYALCVWGALVGVTILHHPKLGAILILILLCLGYWFSTQGLDLKPFGLGIQWNPDEKLMTFGGYEMNTSSYSLSQVALNERYSLVHNQSFSTTLLMLMFTSVTVFSSTIRNWFYPNCKLAIRPTCCARRQYSSELLILGAILILTMLVLSQIWFPRSFDAALPSRDTGLSRFSLPFAVIAIPASLSAFHWCEPSRIIHKE